ncbi:MAG: B12-binding domain-containing radical SAM protein [Candidatus Riflebacteria bacterium]|nr:B12-binding domain-containing radical SAM protein [Candidatus Riflebacteria bacterium]
MITPENREIFRHRKAQANNFLQLTMPYLAGFVSTDSFDIRLIDEYDEPVPYDESFDIAAITVNTPNALHCYRMASRLRLHGTYVVMGGPHVSLLPDEARPYADCLIPGEAEETWPLFLRDFLRGSQRRLYRSDNPPTLERLPRPRWDLVKTRRMARYAVISGRGCRHSCSYCNLRQIYHSSIRERPADEVIDEIATLPGSRFVFWDDNFFGAPEYAKRLLKGLSGLGKEWAAQVTLEQCENLELLQLARKAGCVYLFLGLESFSQGTLREANKGINRVCDYIRLIDRIHGCGISTQAGIVFGFDSDGMDVFDRTMDACEQLGIDGATVSLLTPFPGTPLYDRLKQENRLLTDNWEWFNGKTRVTFQPRRMSPEQLFTGYMRFRRKFFSLRSIFRRLCRSRVNILQSLILNLGYRQSIERNYDRG